MDTPTAADVATEPDETEAIVAAAPAVDEAPAEPETAPSGAPMVDADGNPFTRWRSLAALEGVWTGDNRIADPGTWTWRDLPLTLKVQTDTTMGHDGAKLVGRIDTAELVDASEMIDSRTGQPYGEGAQVVMMTGVFNNRELALQTIEDIRGGFLGGVSADPSDVRYTEEVATFDHSPVSLDDLDNGTVDPSQLILQERWSAARFMGLTITPFPAWEGTYIEILDENGDTAVATKPGAGSREQTAAAVRASAAMSPRARSLTAVTAAAAPVDPPAAWFEPPDDALVGFSINITDEGRIFGLVAPEGVYHIGLPGQKLTVPHSATDYVFFRLSHVKTVEGTVIPTGCITMGTGHADISLGIAAATEHYDNTGTAIADIRVGEDERGIWYSGALRPDVTPEQIRALRGSKLSGDWRPWGEGREMVAVLAVNTPGFPVVRQIVASGRPGALVASFAALVPVSPELDEVRALLPDLRDAAAREQRTRDMELAARREALRARRLAPRRDALRAKLATLQKETA